MIVNSADDPSEVTYDRTGDAYLVAVATQRGNNITGDLDHNGEDLYTTASSPTSTTSPPASDPHHAPSQYDRCSDRGHQIPTRFARNRPSRTAGDSRLRALGASLLPSSDQGSRDRLW